MSHFTAQDLIDQLSKLSDEDKKLPVYLYLDNCEGMEQVRITKVGRPNVTVEDVNEPMVENGKGYSRYYCKNYHPLDEGEIERMVVVCTENIYSDRD
jgi:hypothetical protein